MRPRGAASGETVAPRLSRRMLPYFHPKRGSGARTGWR